MKKRIPYLLILFFPVFLVFGKAIDLGKLNETKEIPINSATIIVFESTDSSGKTMYKALPYQKDLNVPFETHSIWMVFDLKNNPLKNDTLYIYSRHQLPKISLYKKKLQQTTLVGHTGFAFHLKTSSVKGEYNILEIPKPSSGHYLIKISSERYRVGIPELYVSPSQFVDKESHAANKISLVTVGFEVCILFSVLVFWLFNYRRKVSSLLVFFLLLTITDLLYFMARYYVFVFEFEDIPQITNSMVWNVLGDINIFLYYIFFFKFFKIPTKGIPGIILKFGIIFWTIQIFVELSNSTSLFFKRLATNYLNYASVVDFLILLFIFVYVIKFRLKKTEHKIGFIGLVFMLISAAEIAYPHVFKHHDWTGLSSISFQILQFCVIINIFCFITALIYKVVRTENRKRKIESELLRQELIRQKVLQIERERISRDMHDELGAGISAIKLQSEIIKRKTANHQNHEKDIDELFKISDEMNHSMREILWSLNAVNDSIDSFVEYVTIYATNYFAMTNIHFSASVAITNRDLDLTSQTRRNLLLVIKEIFHNIIKHSNAERVTLKLEEDSGILRIQIKDDGVGFDIDHVSRGIGLNSIKKRLDTEKANYKIRSDVAGTSIKIKLDLKQKK